MVPSCFTTYVRFHYISKHIYGSKLFHHISTVSLYIPTHLWFPHISHSFRLPFITYYFMVPLYIPIYYGSFYNSYLCMVPSYFSTQLWLPYISPHIVPLLSNQFWKERMHHQICKSYIKTIVYPYCTIKSYNKQKDKQRCTT